MSGQSARVSTPAPKPSAHQEHGQPHELDHHPDQISGGKQGSPSQDPPTKTLLLDEPILEQNDRLAERNRGFFLAKQLLVLNVLSSPGSGKTTFVQKTVEGLAPALRAGIIVGDLATDNDARRLQATGAPVVQINTGTLCHLDAAMIARAASQLPLDTLDILIIENVGNLVCPAAYDLGEDLRIVMLSVTEGEDKPLKYPPMFHSAHVAIISKNDLSEAAGFNREQAIANLHRISHHATILEVSAKTGHGMDAWLRFLREQKAKKQ
ncbi:MAG TPA: hydrogenase nickel incorporation protein HypB [Candidatus Paceibacterota bacterium]|nr:hydrogenase nickel incorporation protein HypB [Verrucomicrobiota bacterium]HRY50082.1 hydrogenase nickel incorporation protein HypB [Candidatus Paceibacterota bacterium]